jgi:hypothetical protein
MSRFAQIEDSKREPDLFCGHNPLFTFRLAVGYEQLSGGIMTNNSVGHCHSENPAEVEVSL